MFEKNEPPNTLEGYSGEERLERMRAAVEMQNLTRSADAAPIQIVDFDDLDQHLSAMDEPEESRQVLLVKIENHYLALDVLQVDGKKSCIALDAANDYRSYGVMMKVEEHGYTTYMASALSETIERNMQADSASCSLFAFDHCVQLSQEDPIQFHKNIEACSVDEAFTWDQLPVNFLWNVQSNSFLNEYVTKEANQEKVHTVMQNGLTMAQYIATGGYDLKNKSNNNSINVHVFSKVQEAHRLVEMDWLMTRQEMTGEMEEKLVVLRDNIKAADLVPLEKLMNQFAQSSGDPAQSMVKQEFDQLSTTLESSQVAIEKTQQYKDKINAIGKENNPPEEEANITHGHTPSKRS